MTKKTNNEIVQDIDENSVDSAEVDKILRKYDKGSDFRNLSGISNKIVTVILLCFSLYLHFD